MRRFYTLFVMLFFIISAIEANSTIKGVHYKKLTENTAEASLTIVAADEVEILENVVLNGKKYHVVQIGKASFVRNKKVTSVILPPTLSRICEGAFSGLTNLEKVVFPRGYFTIERDAFKGSEAVNNIQGNTLPFQNYLRGGEFFSRLSAVPKFSSFANKKLKEDMEFWQAKKDYETIEQYKKRMTDENRRIQMNEFVEELKREYIALYAPERVSTTIENYDREYEVFTINTDFYGRVFAQVPKTDADIFRQQYHLVEVKPQFGVQGDTLAIVSCVFELDNKTYANAINYSGNGSSDYQFDLPPLDIDLAIAAEQQGPKHPTVDRTLDNDIPQTATDNNNTFVLIFGNEKYKRVAQVPFASNDARVFSEYCKKTLGIPESRVKTYLDASLNDMRHGVQMLVNQLKVNPNARAIVYYAGHGIPSEESRMPYLLPIDGYASDVKTGYNLNDLYDELAAAPSQLTTVFLDACFSGAKRDGDMIAQGGRGVAMAVRNTVPTGNLLVFSAAQGTETAFGDNEHAHGRFTYFLLKHLHDTKGKSTMHELVDFVTNCVRQTSVDQNEGKMQTPTVISSFSLGESWKEIKLR